MGEINDSILPELNSNELEVDNYTVLSKIRGGLGNVFLIQHQRQPDLKYALKVFGHGKSADLGSRAQKLLEDKGETFLTQTESDLLLRLKTKEHPNVVRYIEETTIKYRKKELPAIKMEFIEGVNFGEYLQQHHPEVLASEEAIKIFAQILNGLSYLYSCGITSFGDLKPENIMVTPKGTVKLIDFGLAWTKTQDAVIPGNRLYGAPELFFAPDKVSLVSDYWALGLLMYRALAGKHLFGSDSKEVHELVKKMYHQEKKLPEEYHEKIKTEINNLFFRELIPQLLHPLVEERKKVPLDYFEQLIDRERHLNELRKKADAKITELRSRSLDRLLLEEEGNIVETPLMAFRKRSSDDSPEKFESYPIALEKLLTASTPVIVFGHGGQGKSILATELAKSLLDQRFGERYSGYLPVILEATNLNRKIGTAMAKEPEKIVDLLSQEFFGIKSKPNKTIHPGLLSDFTFVYILDDFQKVNYDEALKKALQFLSATGQNKVILFSRMEKAELHPHINEGYFTAQINERHIPQTVNHFIRRRVSSGREEEFREYLAKYDESISGNFMTLYVLTLIFGEQQEKILRYYEDGNPLSEAIRSGKKLTKTQLYEIQTDFVIGNDINQRTNFGLPPRQVIEEIKIHKRKLAELAFAQVVKQ